MLADTWLASMHQSRRYDWHQQAAHHNKALHDVRNLTLVSGCDVVHTGAVCWLVPCQCNTVVETRRTWSAEMAAKQAVQLAHDEAIVTILGWLVATGTRISVSSRVHPRLQARVLVALAVARVKLAAKVSTHTMHISNILPGAATRDRVRLNQTS